MNVFVSLVSEKDNHNDVHKEIPPVAAADSKHGADGSILQGTKIRHGTARPNSCCGF